MNILQHNYQQVKAAIAAAVAGGGRPAGRVELEAGGMNFPAAVILAE